jgi:hypothetical protein
MTELRCEAVDQHGRRCVYSPSHLTDHHLYEVTTSDEDRCDVVIAHDPAGRVPSGTRCVLDKNHRNNPYSWDHEWGVERSKLDPAPTTRGLVALDPTTPSLSIDVRTEKVDHPAHYGGDTTYEVIKVLEAWWPEGVDFCVGNTIKYLARAGKKGDELEDLMKAAWYLARRIDHLKKESK